MHYTVPFYLAYITHGVLYCVERNLLTSIPCIVKNSVLFWQRIQVQKCNGLRWTFCASSLMQRDNQDTSHSWGSWYGLSPLLALWLHSLKVKTLPFQGSNVWFKSNWSHFLIISQSIIIYYYALRLHIWRVNCSGLQLCLENKRCDDESHGDRHLSSPLHAGIAQLVERLICNQ